MQNVIDVAQIKQVFSDHYKSINYLEHFASLNKIALVHAVSKFDEYSHVKKQDHLYNIYAKRINHSDYSPTEETHLKRETKVRLLYFVHLNVQQTLRELYKDDKRELGYIVSLFGV
jgi:predicted DNA-binding helix-hairpin-helix protein